MPESVQLDGTPEFDSRASRVRVRTLNLLRWVAVAGQATAIVIAWRILGIDLQPVLCLGLVGLSALMNLLSGVYLPRSRRLTPAEVLGLLIFDLCQLAALLYLTGGLNNPFALLLLAPATIAATVLDAALSAVMAALTISLVSLLAVANVPLATVDGTVIAVPQLFGYGFWLAIVIGVVFLALYARRISEELHAIGDALLATQMALAREQKLTDLAGVVAAAAHELGTPLATIKLAASELSDELADRPELKADADLITAQADRCRDILRSMGRSGKDDLHMRAAPFGAVVQEAAEPHSRRKAKIHLALPPGGTGAQPLLRRRPEVIHGLRNLVQNAVDFARANVWIDLDWSGDRLFLRIADDGPGFPPHLIGRIGDPFVRHRPPETAPETARPHYEGMGLGLFIAKTLLERTGATLRFSNSSDPFLTEEERPERSGAQVVVTWPRAALEADPSGPLGENVEIRA